MVKFMVLFAGIGGLVVPGMLLAIWGLLERCPTLNMWIGSKLVRWQILVWPSVYFLMATPHDKWIDYTILALSVGVNMVLYALFGGWLWLGLHKQRWLLYVLIGALLAGWYWLLRVFY